MNTVRLTPARFREALRRSLACSRAKRPFSQTPVTPVVPMPDNPKPEEFGNACFVINPRGHMDFESYSSNDLLAGRYRTAGTDMPTYAPERTVYTVTRTLRRDRIFQFEAHLKRLAMSTLKMLKQLGYKNPWADHEELRIFVQLHLQKALPFFFQRTGAQEARITFMQTLPPESGTKMLFPAIHIEGMPAAPESVHIFMRQGQRTHGKSKPLSWKQEAAEQGLLEDLPDDVNEVVMVDEHGKISEGVSSNFACLQEGALVTAPISANILPGTIRAVFMEAYRGQVVEEQPDLNKIQSWAGAFVLSTSRLCAPVHKITLDFPPIERKVLEFPVDEEDIQGIKQSVIDIMMDHSQPLFDYIPYQQGNKDISYAEEFNDRFRDADL